MSWSCVRLEIEARYDRRHEPERASSRARELERLSRPGASGDADRLRARWGSPRSWLRSAFFCVLMGLSHCHQTGVWLLVIRRPHVIIRRAMLMPAMAGPTATPRVRTQTLAKLACSNT